MWRSKVQNMSKFDRDCSREEGSHCSRNISPREGEAGYALREAMLEELQQLANLIRIVDFPKLEAHCIS